jgi:uncharacterized membrane protein
MQRMEEKITIDVAAEAVYAYVSDFARHGEWGGHGLTVTKDDPGPTAVGSTFSTEAKQFGTQRERSTITDLDAGKLFGWDSKGGLGLTHHSFELTEQGGSTEVTKSAEIVQPTFLAKLTGFKLAKDIPAGLRTDLANIKSYLEGAAS